MHILRLRTCAGTKHPNSDEIRIEITMEKEKEYCKLNAYNNNRYINNNNNNNNNKDNNNNNNNNKANKNNNNNNEEN